MVDQRAVEEWEKEEWVKKWREARQIKCPHCGYIFEGEDVYDYVSYWGDGEDIEAECMSCEESFWVREIVDRTWEVAVTEEELS